MHHRENGCHSHQLIGRIKHLYKPFHNAARVFGRGYIAVHFLFAGEAHIYGVVVVNGTQETAFFQAVIGRHWPFVRVDKQTCCGSQNEIAVRCSFLEYTAIQRSDIGVGIKMIPGNVGKIDDVGIGNCSVVCAQRHARLDVFPMVLKRMLGNFFVGRIGLVNARDFS